MTGLIGKKIGMTSVYNNGVNTPCTLLEVGPCFVTQLKNEEIDGYASIQLSYDEAKEKNVSATILGHFKKAGVSPKKKIVEFRDFDKEVALGQELKIDDILKEGEFVDVVGTSKGKGFQGVVKRYNFGGVGQATHGQHNRLRAPGSIGACSTPSRVFKGMRMGGRMGSDRVKSVNLEVVKILSDRNIVLVKGSVAGAKNSYVTIEK